MQTSISDIKPNNNVTHDHLTKATLTRKQDYHPNYLSNSSVPTTICTDVVVSKVNDCYTTELLNPVRIPQKRSSINLLH